MDVFKDPLFLKAEHLLRSLTKTRNIDSVTQITRNRKKATHRTWEICILPELWSQALNASESTVEDLGQMRHLAVLTDVF